ncbi:hypothetical protein BGW42_007266 [Actinomortierella wolfii]|nr:hypothetical protein BGW42_007266 [Actinomortierella wolfii]
MSGQKVSLEALMSVSGPGLFVTPPAASTAPKDSTTAAPAAAMSPHAPGVSCAPSQTSSMGRDNDMAVAAAHAEGLSNQQGHKRPWDHRQQGQQPAQPQGDFKKKKKKRSKNKNRGVGGSGALGGAGVGGGGGVVGGLNDPGDLAQAYQAIYGEDSGSATTNAVNPGTGPTSELSGTAGPSGQGHRQHHHHHHHHHHQPQQQHQQHTPSNNNKKRKQWPNAQQDGDDQAADHASDKKRRKGGNRHRGHDPNKATLTKNEKLARTFYNRDDGQQLARNLDERPELVGLGTRAGGDDDFDALLTDHMQKTTQEMQQQMEAEAKRLEMIQKKQERLIKMNEAKMKREAEKLAAATTAAAAATATASTVSGEGAGQSAVASMEGVSGGVASLSSAGTAVTATEAVGSSAPQTAVKSAEEQTNSASTTTKPQRKFIPRILCIYWARGRCTNENCTFKHDPSIPQRPPSPPPAPKKIDAICKYEKTGSCTRGDACQFSHDLKSVPCYHYFIKGYCQHSAEACRFSHENATEAQLQELREEWNQKKLLNAPQFQQQQQQQPQQSTQTASTVPPGSFGTGATTDALMMPGVSYGTAATTTPFSAQHETPPLQLSYGSGSGVLPVSQQTTFPPQPPSTDGGEPSM